MSVEAMKQALEAFDAPILADEFKQAMRLRKACDALRQAIEQAEQAVDWEAVSADQAMTIAMMKQREWVGLTDEERYLNEARSEEEIEYARAIEAKLREKNAYGWQSVVNPTEFLEELRGNDGS